LIDVLMHVCNREVYGYLPDSVEDRRASFAHLRIEHLLKGANKTYNEPLPITQNIEASKVEKKRSKLGFDEIYVINLERRDDRKKRIESTLDDLEISYRVVKAVDGTAIDEAFIKSLDIKLVPNYRDPYNDRVMNYGEIGCFLSHYFIWKEVCRICI
jgi:collagen beta-1,O-galactosyltransferase